MYSLVNVINLSSPACVTNQQCIYKLFKYTWWKKLKCLPILYWRNFSILYLNTFEDRPNDTTQASEISIKDSDKFDIWEVVFFCFFGVIRYVETQLIEFVRVSENSLCIIKPVYVKMLSPLFIFNYGNLNIDQTTCGIAFPFDTKCVKEKWTCWWSWSWIVNLTLSPWTFIWYENVCWLWFWREKMQHFDFDFFFVTCVTMG